MSQNFKKIKAKVLTFLQKYNLTEKNQTLLVAFSGGIDSACLLDVLVILSKEYGFKVISAHLNHNWRAEESKKEELRAENIALENNIEFYSETLSDQLPQTEEEARNQRYKFFNKITKKTNITAIITGHTLSDNVETILYRIIKGTGTFGLKGIPEVRHQENNPSIFRPLLEITREETTQYCAENDLKPNIDSSNLEQKYARNKIRLSLLPELKKYNSCIESSLLRLSMVAKDAEELTDEYLSQIKKEVYVDNHKLIPTKFLELSTPAQKKLLLDFFLKNDILYDYERIEKTLTFIKKSSQLKSGKTLSLTKDLWLFASTKEIKLVNELNTKKEFEQISLNMNGETFCPELNKTVTIEPWQGEKPNSYPKETEQVIYADLSAINQPITLRTRKAGDIIQPFGMQQKTKLKKYLINKGVPKFERDELLLLTFNNEIIWVAGVGTSELLRIRNIPTHKIYVN